MQERNRRIKVAELYQIFGLSAGEHRLHVNSLKAGAKKTGRRKMCVRDQGVESDEGRERN